MILDLFLIGLVVTLEPIPLTAMILLLAAERGLMKGLGFTLGWLLTLVGIVALTVLVTGGKPLIPQSAPSTGALAVKLAIGVAAAGCRLPSQSPAVVERTQEAAQMDVRHRPHQPDCRGGARFLPSALGPRGGGRGHHHAGQALERQRSTSASSLFCLLCTASYFALEIYAALRPDSREEQAQRAARMDQHAHGPGDRVPFVGARALPDGEEHLRPGQRRVDPVTPRAEAPTPGGLAALGSSSGPQSGSNTVTSIDP